MNAHVCYTYKWCYSTIWIHMCVVLNFFPPTIQQKNKVTPVIGQKKQQQWKKNKEEEEEIYRNRSIYSKGPTHIKTYYMGVFLSTMHNDRLYIMYLVIPIWSMLV